MKFTKYDSIESFGADTLEILLENEVQNNLPISFIRNERGFDTSNWLLVTIKDEAGIAVLIAACTPPFNIVMYETGNKPNDAAINLLSCELHGMGFTFPGVMAEQGLARRFAEAHIGKNGFHRHSTMNIMRLDKVNDVPKAPGFARSLREDDLYFMPYWERIFGKECRVESYDILTTVNKLKQNMKTGLYYIWEDGFPVSTASNRRNTENGAVVNFVYTPPHYRSKGYASSVVAELSQALLNRGNKFCCLFADTENPISCGIYRKIGYYDLCVVDVIKFDKGERDNVQ